LGADAWQSPNGFDILGVVIYWLADDDSGNPKLEAVPLDFIRLAQSHTGDYLAQKLALVVEKFEIQHKVRLFISLSIISSDHLELRRKMIQKTRRQWMISIPRTIQMLRMKIPIDTYECQLKLFCLHSLFFLN
jgi:transposase-like protein